MWLLIVSNLNVQQTISAKTRGLQAVCSGAWSLGVPIHRLETLTGHWEAKMLACQQLNF